MVDTTDEYDMTHKELYMFCLDAIANSGLSDDDLVRVTGTIETAGSALDLMVSRVQKWKMTALFLAAAFYAL